MMELVQRLNDFTPYWADAMRNGRYRAVANHCTRTIQWIARSRNNSACDHEY